MSKNSNKKVTKKEPLFDPRKSYSWNPEETFTLNGREFSIAYNNMNEFLSNPFSPVTILKVADVFSILQKLLIEKVENGVITAKDVNPEEQVG